MNIKIIFSWSTKDYEEINNKIPERSVKPRIKHKMYSLITTMEIVVKHNAVYEKSFKLPKTELTKYDILRSGHTVLTISLRPV